MECYDETHFYDDDTLLSDIDMTPMTIRVQCSSCHKVEVINIMSEDLENYTRNNDGTYTSRQGECVACLTQGYSGEVLASSLLESDGMDTYKLYYHVDESCNAYLDGVYTWEQALKHKAQLLQRYPSVTLDGIRFWA